MLPQRHPPHRLSPPCFRWRGCDVAPGCWLNGQLTPLCATIVHREACPGTSGHPPKSEQGGGGGDTVETASAALSAPPVPLHSPRKLPCPWQRSEETESVVKSGGDVQRQEETGEQVRR